MRCKKSMIHGKYQKLNGKFIKSVGYFAYDGCHKIYICENLDDIKEAMLYGYYLYPIEEIKRTYEQSSCPLKFINISVSNPKPLIKQGQKAIWSEVKANDKEINKIVELGDYYEIFRK